MPDFKDISNWETQPWVSTGGTRAKELLISPEGVKFYFKRSERKAATHSKPGKYFKYEFWSEIIAYELGTMLGLDVLKYDLAVFEGEPGCLSKSMVEEDEELIEGVKFIQAYNANFNPLRKECRKWYSFDLIERSLHNIKFEGGIEHIIRMVIFDAVIGNSDRHQENWAVIERKTPFPEVAERIKSSLGKDRGIFSLLQQWILGKLIDPIVASYEQRKEKKEPIPMHLFLVERRFSQLYDNGCSFAREISEDRVAQFLEDDKALENYLNKGASELHIDNIKVSHFEVFRYLLKGNHAKKTKEIASKILSAYNPDSFKSILDTINESLPEEYHSFKLPHNRKLLIHKIVTLRIETLHAILNNV
jgi:hypothetical protein